MTDSASPWESRGQEHPEPCASSRIAANISAVGNRHPPAYPAEYRAVARYSRASATVHRRSDVPLGIAVNAAGGLRVAIGVVVFCRCRSQGCFAGRYSRRRRRRRTRGRLKTAYRRLAAAGGAAVTEYDVGRTRLGHAQSCPVTKACDTRLRDRDSGFRLAVADDVADRVELCYASDSSLSTSRSVPYSKQ